MKGKKDKDVHLQAITMIDPATGWIEKYIMLKIGRRKTWEKRTLT